MHYIRTFAIGVRTERVNRGHGFTHDNGWLFQEVGPSIGRIEYRVDASELGVDPERRY